MTKTLVLQSHRQPLPHAWLAQCCESVRRWCTLHQFEYRWLGDEMFNFVPGELRQKTQDQPVVASDLARLLWIQEALLSGYDCVVWCDADTLVINPEEFLLSVNLYELGREVWVQPAKHTKRPKVYVKVHNAFMMFRQSNPFLDFYIDSSIRLLTQHPGPYVSQFIGPKFLTAIHNLVSCPVQEGAGVLSPWVVHDLLRHDGVYLNAFKQRCERSPCALNLCASSVVNGDVSDSDMMQVCQILTRGDLI